MSEFSPGKEPGQETDKSSPRWWEDRLSRLVNDPRHNPAIPEERISARDSIARGERSPQVSNSWFGAIEGFIDGLIKTGGITDERILKKVAVFKDMLNDGEAETKFAVRLHTREDINYAKWIVRLACNNVSLEDFEKAEKEGFPIEEGPE